MSIRPALFGLVLAGALTTAGCQSDPPALAAVSGRVTYLGAPLSCGVIVFCPDGDAGCYGSCATGEIGANGRYVLKTDGATGAIPGWHRVTIAVLDAGFGARLPDRFRDPSSSNLRAEVRAGQANEIDFKLEGP